MCISEFSMRKNCDYLPGFSHHPREERAGNEKLYNLGKIRLCQVASNHSFVQN